MASEQIVSRARVAAHGEVFTAEREVKAMCDLAGSEIARIGSRVLEPACGTGNFLEEILRRKMRSVRMETVLLRIRLRQKRPEKARRPKRPKGRRPRLLRPALDCRLHRIRERFFFQSARALSSIYGIDILEDNVAACRKRLLAVWKDEAAAAGMPMPPSMERLGAFLLGRNVVHGDALSMAVPDTDASVVLSEWTFCGRSMVATRTDWDMRERLKREGSPAGEARPGGKRTKQKKGLSGRYRPGNLMEACAKDAESRPEPGPVFYRRLPHAAAGRA